MFMFDFMKLIKIAFNNQFEKSPETKRKRRNTYSLVNLYKMKNRHLLSNLIKGNKNNKTFNED